MGYVLPPRYVGGSNEIRMTVNPMTRWGRDGWRWSVRQGLVPIGHGWKRYEADAWVAARAVVRRRLSEIAKEQDVRARTRTETIKP